MLSFNFCAILILLTFLSIFQLCSSGLVGQLGRVVDQVRGGGGVIQLVRWGGGGCSDQETGGPKGVIQVGGVGQVG